MARLFHVDVEGVGVHRHHLLLHLLCGFGEVDAVAEALGHLGLAVGAREAAADLVLRQQDGGFDEGVAVDVVEAAHDFGGLLEHGFLVLTGGHRGGAEGGDVGGLGDGIGEEAHGDAGLEAAHTDFGLHGGVALEAADRDEVHEVEGEFAELGYLALDKDGDFGGVEPYGEVVEGYLNHVLAHLLGVVYVVGEGLGVGDEDEHLLEIAGFLEFYAALEGAYVVAYVETAGGAVACEDYLFF